MGPNYSDAPLVDADKRAKALVRLFPNEATSKQRELREAMVRIKYLQAEREWESALFRYRQGENLSAKMYFQRLVEDYADTPFAQSAQEKLDELADKPDRPPQLFTPIIKLFQVDNDDRPWRKPGEEPPQ
jgi:outer membrane protein assembly factor BamD (BamD/ComL family)